VVRELLEQHYDPVYQKSMSRHYAGFDSATVLDLPDAAPATLQAAAAQLMQGRGSGLREVKACAGRQPTVAAHAHPPAMSSPPEDPQRLSYATGRAIRAHPVRQITLNDPLRWLALGWADLMRCPLLGPGARPGHGGLRRCWCLLSPTSASGCWPAPSAASCWWRQSWPRACTP
jgi:hypothetical protein